MASIGVMEFRRLFEGATEFALIDPREEWIFSRGRVFATTKMPLSRLKLHVEDGVPQCDTMTVLCDDCDNLSELSGDVLSGMG
jgi:hypothetical protein